MASPLVSIVVLSWNTIDDTKKCIESLRRLTYPAFEIILVDNGSSDGSKEFFSQLDNIEYVDLPINTGFTGGQIAGFEQAKGEFVALINSDAVVDSLWLTVLIDAMTKDNSIAAAGGRAYVLDETHEAYDSGSPFYSYQVLDVFKGYALTLATGDKQVCVNSISGAGVLIRRSAIEKIGYFDDRFFAYYEETDLFARFKRAGYSIVYNPEALTWHKIRGSSANNPFFYLFQMHKNRFLFAVKNYDRRYLYSFLKSYSRDFLSSLKRRSKNTDDDARIQAFVWNIKNSFTTIRERIEVQKLGPTYSELLLKDSAQIVSVVVPCYNYARFVGEAIESVLAQTQQPLEIIVINDGSTDDSLDVISGYGASIRVINQENRGIIATKNRGLEEAKGDWIIFLDADDFMEPTYIEKCISLARRERADLVYTDMRLFGAKNEVFRSIKYSRSILHRNNFIHNSSLMRLDFVRSVGGYKDEMKDGYEDWELYLTLDEAEMRASHVPEPLLNYRQHPKSSRNTLAYDKSAAIYTQVYELHPSLSQWSWGRLSWSLAQLYRRVKDQFIHSFLGKFFLTRKLVGLLRLIKHGKLQEIQKKTVVHISNAQHNLRDKLK